jgi:hypothetical protein
MLPGQKNTTGGVSNFLFGANIMNYAFSSFNASAQANLKQVGVTVLRIPLADQSGNPLSDAALANFVAGCKASGAAMLGILPHQSQSFGQHAVQYLGANCLLYELSNEPDLNNMSSATYAAMWNSWIPALRKINPQAAFIGPVLGAVSNFGSYAVPFLKAVNAAGNLPDAVSFHDYPCGSHPTQAVCTGKAANIGNDAKSIAAQIVGAIGKPLPIAITEWNVDWNSPVIAYAQNSAFVTSWSIAALEGMAAAGVVLANQFEQNGTTGGAGWFGGPPLATEIAKYQAGGSPPTGTGLGNPGTVAGIPVIGPVIAPVVAAFTSIFGGQGFVPIAGQNITLAPTADVTQLLQALDEYMLIQNPFTENMGALPEDSIGLGVTTFTFTDPFSWVEQFGTNLFYDSAAALLRALFLFVGTMLLIKIIGEFIDYEAIGDAISTGVESALKVAALV